MYNSYLVNKTNSSNAEAPFLDLNLSISNGKVTTKVYDTQDDFDFEIVNFLFLDCEVPRITSYNRNKFLTAKLLK